MEDRIVAGRQGSSGIATRSFDDLYQMGSFFLVIGMKSACMWDTKYQ